MRILLVTMQLGRGYTQGTERYVTTLGACLSGAGHDVAFLAGDPLRHRSARELGARVDAAEAGELGGELYHYPTSGWMALEGRGRGRLRNWIESWRPDIIHVANPAHVGTSVIDVARACSIPVVVTTMDFWWVCPKATLLRHDASICTGAPGWRDCLKCLSLSHPRASTRILGHLPHSLTPASLPLYLGRGLMRGMALEDMRRWPFRREFLIECLRQANHVIFPSAATREVLEPYLPAARYTHIPYGLGPEWFVDQRPARGKPFEAGDLTIGFAGALLPHKGPHVLLKAIQHLGWQTAQIRLAGPGSDEAFRTELVRGAEGLNVEFTGALSATQMPAFLRSLDVLVLPSLWPENLPFILLEAQAANVPVIASRLSGVLDQIGEGRLLFEPGSSQQLADSLEWFRLYPDRHGIRPVMTAGEMTQRTLAVYQSSLARTSPAMRS